jgi:hypothetical protein
MSNHNTQMKLRVHRTFFLKWDTTLIIHNQFNHHRFSVIKMMWYKFVILHMNGKTDISFQSDRRKHYYLLYKISERSHYF